MIAHKLRFIEYTTLATQSDTLLSAAKCKSINASTLEHITQSEPALSKICGKRYNQHLTFTH